MRIGIDAIALAVPSQYLELADLAVARGVAPGKYTEGLGVTRMAIAAAHEDPVALAANAARRLFAVSSRSPSEIGLFIVGSESAVDHSKPIAAWVHRLAGLPERCRVYESKHACFGATAGVLAAVDWIASGAARGRAALVVASDVARYELGTAGEPTQGAGAVAMLISERPRLVEIEVGASGSYARDVDDFWRPLDRKDAVVDGQYSVGCYLAALTGAYGAWKALEEEAATANDGAGRGARASLARTVYHVPYGKMARKAHRHRLGLDGVDERTADACFGVEVGPSLALPSVVGNVYTGSLWLALGSLLDAEAGALEGQRVGLFSYGSGCTAEFFAVRVAEGAGDAMRSLALAAPLALRSSLTVAQYEALRRADATNDRLPVGSIVPPEDGRVAFLGVDGERRVYTQPG